MPLFTNEPTKKEPLSPVKRKGKPAPVISPDEEEFQKQQAKMHQQELRIKDLNGELEIAKKNMNELNTQIESLTQDRNQLVTQYQKRIAELDVMLVDCHKAIEDQKLQLHAYIENTKRIPGILMLAEQWADKYASSKHRWEKESNANPDKLNYLKFKQLLKEVHF